jgi:hypothetical protein
VILLAIVQLDAYCACTSPTSYAPFSVYFAEAGNYDPAYVNPTNQHNEPGGRGQIVDPTTVVVDYEAAFAAAVSTWEDDAIAIGAAPDFTLMGDNSVTYSSLATDTTAPVLQVVILDELAWSSTTGLSSAAYAHVDVKAEVQVGDVCTQRYVMYIRGEKVQAEALPATLDHPDALGSYDDKSAESIIIHELGHVLGLADDTVNSSTMSAFYPGLSDASVGLPRITSDAIAGAAVKWPGASEGVNLTLWPVL